MSTTPRDLLQDASTSALNFEEAQGTKFEFTWQELAHASRYVSEAGWQRSQIPTILESFPENIVISPQLRNILLWSLQRSDEGIVETPETPNHPQDPNTTANLNTVPKDTPAELEANEAPVVTSRADEGERSITSSRTKSRGAKLLLSRLRHLRQDVAAKAASRGQHPSGTRSTAFAAVDDVPENGECVSCFDEHSKPDLVHLACSHDYCKPCAKELILNAMKTESAFPPKCCLTEIPLKAVLACLDNKQRDNYKDKAAEYAIPAGHRWYCPEPKCSKWIQPEKLHREPRAEVLHMTKTKTARKTLDSSRLSKWLTPKDGGGAIGVEPWSSSQQAAGTLHVAAGQTDKDRRIAELQTRRWERDRQQQEEDAAAQAEADEIAGVIARIEEMERQEAIRLAEEERQRQLEEELILARLEEARLLEEIAKREAEEEAERLFRRTLIESSEEECQTLMRTLMQIINFQHAALMSNHEAEEHSWLQGKEMQQALALEESSMMASWLEENISKRTQTLHNKQREEWERLLRQGEEEEDDMFMQMHMYLRDKPSREQREKRMRDTFHQQQQEKQEALRKKHEEERRKLELSTYYENEGFQRAQNNRLDPSDEQFQASLQQLGRQIGCDRRWFQFVNTRRIGMVKEHKRLVLAQLEAEDDPVGLTEEQARNIEPTLPTMKDGQPESTELIHFEPTTPPPPVPHHSETIDLYGMTKQVSSNPGTPIQQTSPPPIPHSIATFDGTSQLNRSDTTTRPIPGAYPASTPSTTATSVSKRSESHYLNVFKSAPSRPSRPVAKPSAVSMSGMMAMSFMVSARNDAAANDSDGRSTSTSTSPSMSLTSTDTADTRRTSKTSTVSVDADSQHESPTGVVTGRGSDSIGSGNGIGKGRNGFFGRLGRKREMSEDEIRRRMSRCVGDGFGG
ncbi:hypothetical protein PMZ80_004945 [Knufia obscura]|uniref:RING-type domain-containing protein n=1 Tax=Knufia obscura TaxID=1635080 RepID=A0ABR0RPS3_9EURO|nr:hypothetical protein PMZ80_004945 [Knufia obscura]